MLRQSQQFLHLLRGTVIEIPAGYMGFTMLLTCMYHMFTCAL